MIFCCRFGNNQNKDSVRNKKVTLTLNCYGHRRAFNNEVNDNIYRLMHDETSGMLPP